MATILIIDDEPDVCQWLVGALRLAGHTPYAVHSGARALTLLQTLLVDLVVLDVMMPDMDGLDVLRAIRADARLAGQKVVLYSNVAALVTDDQSARGAQRVLSKAAPIREFLSEVESLLNTGRN
jgi:CheY-like chemotaxis protein